MRGSSGCHPAQALRLTQCPRSACHKSRTSSPRGLTPAKCTCGMRGPWRLAWTTHVTTRPCAQPSRRVPSKRWRATRRKGGPWTGRPSRSAAWPPETASRTCMCGTPKRVATRGAPTVCRIHPIRTRWRTSNGRRSRPPCSHRALWTPRSAFGTRGRRQARLPSTRTSRMST